MTRWLSIVGLGEDGLDGLSPLGRHLVDSAGVLVGGERHLGMLPDDGRERLTWTRPLMDLVDRIVARRQRGVCILATGDPMWFGIGVTFAKRVPAEEMTILPAPSAFALASARLGWSLSEVECLTLHGRPMALLLPALYPGARVLALSDGGRTPREVAALLTERGFGDSRLTVLSHMGGERETRDAAMARNWTLDDVPAFNTLAIECVAQSGATVLPRAPGLPDDAFEHDGQMTKREVRAITLSRLGPLPGQCLWDVGAGCGSVAIEWLRAAGRSQAVAVERDEGRRAMMAANAAALGVPDLAIVAGAAPDALADLPRPDAVFVGGGASQPGVMERCWRALEPGGRLVANAVTLEGEAALLRWHGDVGGDLTRLQISRADPVGGLTGWRPAMPVTQWAVTRT